MNADQMVLSGTVLIGMVSGGVEEIVKSDKIPSRQNADLFHSVTIESINETILRYYRKKAQA